MHLDRHLVMHLKIRALAALVLLGGAGAGTLIAQSVPSRGLAPRPFVPTGAPLAAAPFQRGDRVFNTDATGNLFVRDGLAGKPRVVLPGGSYGAVTPSSDGRYLAYTLPSAGPTPAGYDVRIRSVENGRDMPELLRNAILSREAWTHNEKGFFYVREDPADHRQRVYFHSVGKPQSRDPVVLSQQDHPDWHYLASVSDDGLFAIFTIEHATDMNTRLYFMDLADADHPNVNAPVVHLVDEFTARYRFIDNAGSRFFFLQSDRNAPLGNVVLANTDVTRPASWGIVIPQTGDTLLYARTAGDQFVLPVYRSGGESVAHVYGPPDPSEIRAEFRKRIDSLKKERDSAERNGRRDRGADEAMRLRPQAPIRLERDRDIPIPTGASILAMNSVADREDVFYTLRMPDGSTRSFLYNVKNRRSEPFPQAQ